MSLIEANSLGIPVTIIFSMKDICRHSGLLINPYNYNNQKYILLMNDKELRRKMVMKAGANARKYNFLYCKKFFE